MEIQAYNFFFHPFNEDHSTSTKVLSVITNIALTVLTAGIYLVIFALAHIKERFSMTAPDDPKLQRPKMSIPKGSGYVGKEALKQKQMSHLIKLQSLASSGQWQHLQTHTTHPDSGFDWWMFPTNRRSAGQGDKYKLSSEDIKELKQDEQFMQSYREGVILIAKSWGFDLENKQDVTTSSQKWTGYQVRLGKMLHSLTLFDQRDLIDNLTYFIDKKNIRASLQGWIQKFI